MTDIQIKQFHKKITQGLSISRQRLVEQTKKNGGELVVMQNGKIVHVKAEDL